MFTIPSGYVMPWLQWLLRAFCMFCWTLRLHWRPTRIRRRPAPAATIGSMTSQVPAPRGHPRRKPDWVRCEVLRLAVHLQSCRRVADAFNRIHGRRATVQRTFVHDLCRVHAAEIDQRRRAMRRCPPWPLAPNLVWALDLTQLPGASHLTLGLIDHGSRRLLRLKVLMRKCTWTLLSHLCLAIAEFGLPAAIRTDNEGMFTSRLWRRALKWAGIRHQRSTPGCPWQNGRIERLFGTLKPLLRGLILPSRAAAQAALDEFTGFYNHVRPHQGLGGLTPIEAWHGLSQRDVLCRAGRGRWVQALGGRLAGYHLRL
jgi:transposase InsO family protein